MQRDMIGSGKHTETNRAEIHTETNTVVCRETGLGLRYTQRQTELYAKRKFEV